MPMTEGGRADRRLVNNRRLVNKGIDTERMVVMAPGTTLPALRLMGVEGLCELYQALAAEGVPRDRPWCAGRCGRAAGTALSRGTGVRLGCPAGPGGYRLRRRADEAALGHSAGSVADPKLASLTAQLRRLGMAQGAVDRVLVTFDAASPALGPLTPH
jgi:hypothetical protein